MSLKEEDCVPDTEGEAAGARSDASARVLTHLSLPRAGLSLMEQDILRDWKNKFEAKYAKVGTVKR